MSRHLRLLAQLGVAFVCLCKWNMQLRCSVPCWQGTFTYSSTCDVPLSASYISHTND